MTRHAKKTVLLIAIAALMSVMCSITNPVGVAPTPEEAGKQATLSVMQATLNAAAQVSRQTVEAWMTEVSPVTAQPGGQTLPTIIPTGTIKGQLSYPGEKIPPLRVVAFNINTGEYASVEVKDRGDYILSQIPVGEYHVVAYPMEGDSTQAGGYSEAVTCGLEASCEDHTLIIVKVEAGKVTSGIDPGDWYAPAGTFPPQP